MIVNRFSRLLAVGLSPFTTLRHDSGCISRTHTFKAGNEVGVKEKLLGETYTHISHLRPLPDITSTFKELILIKN